MITSTNQEKEEQYSKYQFYAPHNKIVIPPGVDLSRFKPPRRRILHAPVVPKINRFLRQPNKPMILAISRADERKNIATLVRAYARNADLQRTANLVIIAGNREKIREMDKGARTVLSKLLFDIDRYDLYGKVAYPKQHSPEDVPDIYRYAAKQRSVFVNPALTEPFGLTLLEAAASGLPVVTTNDGGPRDILALCRNGYLVDPLNEEEMAEAILCIVRDTRLWKRLSNSGKRGVEQNYTWRGHVNKYINLLIKVLRKQRKKIKVSMSEIRMPEFERFLITDIDNTLIGEEKSLRLLVSLLKKSDRSIGFGIATGRHLESVLKVLKKYRVPTPEILVTDVGTQIYYGPNLAPDTSWERHINYRWDSDAAIGVLEELPGLKMQPDENQNAFKISYYLDPEKAPTKKEIVRHFRENGLSVRVIVSHETLLDILPIRASKGHAIRFLNMKWGIPPENIVISGDSGNDEDMLGGCSKGIVVGNYSPEIEHLREHSEIYFAEATYAAGIIEGLLHYNFIEQEPFPEDVNDQATGISI